MNLSDRRYLVETDWLQDHLDEPELRVVECTSLIVNYFEPSAADGLILESGRKDWEQGHIPNSAFADFLDDLSDRSNERLMYAMPSAEQFSAAMSKLGVGEGTAVVLYDRQLNMWASRLWWMLRASGFDNAAVLNGGWIKWSSEGRPVSTEAPSYPRAHFVAKPRPELIAAREQVQAAIGNERAGLVNALDPDEFAGKPPHRYARAGRIPSSVNVPFFTTADPETHVFASDDELKKVLDASGATDKDEVICYCGGGIAACNTALALTRLGIDNVSVYDGSMTEWTADPSLPLEVG